MKNFSSSKNKLTLSIAFAAGFSFMPMSHAISPVLVIDEGADLSHPLLSSRALNNVKELGGAAGIDDDGNGFVDDIAGWNNVSNDAQYFPDRMKQVFERNKDKVRDLFALYSRVENGDMDAMRELQSDPFGAQVLSGLLGFSHGTHVAGIVAAEYKKETPFIQSFNVFTPSNDDHEPSSIIVPKRHSFNSITPGSKLGRNFIKKFATVVFDNMGPIVTTRTSVSMFDSLSNFEPLLAESTMDANQRSERLRSYLRTHPQSVVNLSLGFSRALYIDSLAEIWTRELMRRGLPENTARTAHQESVLIGLADKMIEINKSFYSNTFAEFSDILFVVAAGNDGDASIPDAGNNDLRPVWPSNFSKEFPNVIAIAAVDANNLLTDFSDFGATTVNIAAPGKAIKSTAPGGNEVAMSGTSMASPYVAGIAARLRTLNPKLTAAQTRTIIEKTGRKFAALTGKVTTGAVVDADSAAQAAITAKDIEFDQAIESTLKERAFLRGASGLLNGFTSLADPSVKEKSKTSPFVRNMIRSLFYK